MNTTIERNILRNYIEENCIMHIEYLKSLANNGLIKTDCLYLTSVLEIIKKNLLNKCTDDASEVWNIDNTYGINRFIISELQNILKKSGLKYMIGAISQNISETEIVKLTTMMTFRRFLTEVPDIIASTEYEKRAAGTLAKIKNKVPTTKYKQMDKEESESTAIQEFLKKIGINCEEKSYDLEYLYEIISAITELISLLEQTTKLTTAPKSHELYSEFTKCLGVLNISTLENTLNYLTELIKEVNHKNTKTLAYEKRSCGE